MHISTCTWNNKCKSNCVFSGVICNDSQVPQREEFYFLDQSMDINFYKIKPKVKSTFSCSSLLGSCEMIKSLFKMADKSLLFVLLKILIVKFLFTKSTLLFPDNSWSSAQVISILAVLSIIVSAAIHTLTVLSFSLKKWYILLIEIILFLFISKYFATVRQISDVIFYSKSWPPVSQNSLLLSNYSKTLLFLQFRSSWLLWPSSRRTSTIWTASGTSLWCVSFAVTTSCDTQGDPLTAALKARWPVTGFWSLRTSVFCWLSCVAFLNS